MKKMEIGLLSTVFGKKMALEGVIPRIKGMGVDFVEIKPNYHTDTPIIQSVNGTVKFSRAAFEYIAGMCSGINFQFHLNNRMDKILYNITTGEDKEVSMILNYAGILSQYTPDFVMPLHTDTQAEGINITESRGMDNALKVLDKICERWNFKGKLAIETMPEPGVYEGRHSLGYSPGNMEKLIEGREGIVGICIDTGHINGALNSMHHFEEFAHLLVYEMHFHGNLSHKGEVDDLHVIPTEQTLQDYDKIVNFLKNYHGKLELEVRLKDDIKSHPEFGSAAELYNIVKGLRVMQP